jgi:hypothetical protein
VIYDAALALVIGLVLPAAFALGLRAHTERQALTKARATVVTSAAGAVLLAVLLIGQFLDSAIDYDFTA